MHGSVEGTRPEEEKDHTTPHMALKHRLKRRKTVQKAKCPNGNRLRDMTDLRQGIYSKFLTSYLTYVHILLTYYGSLELTEPVIRLLEKRLVIT